MFAYNPQTTDQSGAIIGQGQVNAAQTNAQAKVQLTNDIGGALVSLAGAYADNKAMDAKAKGYDQVGKILGDSMFKNNPAVGTYLSELRTMKNPMERISGYETLFGLAGSMSNAMMAQGRFGLQQQALYVEAGLKNQQNIAGGNVPHGSMGVPRPPKGISNVEPDLPVDDENLPAVTTPAAVAPMPIPGGDESMRKYNEWKSKRGK